MTILSNSLMLIKSRKQTQLRVDLHYYGCYQTKVHVVFMHGALI